MRKVALIIIMLFAVSGYCLAETKESERVSKEAAPALGKLYIYSEVAKSEIYLDDIYQTTDFVELATVEVGEHTVKVTDGGDILYDQIVTVSSEGITKIIVTDNRWYKKKEALIPLKAIVTKEPEKWPLRPIVGIVYYHFTYSQSYYGATASIQLKPVIGLSLSLRRDISPVYAIEAGGLLGINNAYPGNYRDVPFSVIPICLNGLMKSDWFHVGGGVNYAIWGLDAGGITLAPGFGFQLFAGCSFEHWDGEIGYMATNGSINQGGVSVSQATAGPFFKIAYKI